jgi:hypothetical protein
MLANKQLRDDLKSGKLSLGYIINSLRYQRDVLGYFERENKAYQTANIEASIKSYVDNVASTLREQISNDTKKAISDSTLAKKIKRVLNINT